METDPRKENEIRQKNRGAVFALFRRGGEWSRQQIAGELGLSLPTVTQNLKELTELGLVCRTGTMACTVGRRATAYALASRARIAVGLDITRRQVTAVALDLRGRVLCTLRRSRSFDRSPAYSALLGELVQEAVHLAGGKDTQVLGVGIALPGLLTRDKQALSYCAFLGFPQVTLAELAARIPYPAALCHDTAAAGFAEVWNAPEPSTAFYLMLNASVGGSVYVGGKSYEGDNLRSCEVGHMLLVPGGQQCYCGNRGCVDPYCGGAVLADAAGGSLERFFALLEQHSPLVLPVWQSYLEHLAQVVGNLRMLYDCNVILGGNVGSRMEPYMQQLRQLTARQDPFQEEADYLLPCRYRQEPVATGAALGFISQFLDGV